MKDVVIFSGGMDSATALHRVVVEQRRDVKAITFDYGQRHRKEIDYAMDFIKALGEKYPGTKIEHMIVSMDHVGRSLKGSALTDPEVAVPEGHYAAESMKATVVPNRNMMMLSVAVAIAIADGAERVVYGAHAGDHAIYPDCREEFVEAMSHAISLCDYKPPKLLAPFVNIGKHDITKMGHASGVRYDLTWSCYKGGEVHCGKCGTCVERKEAFQLAGVPDPTEYES